MRDNREVARLAHGSQGRAPQLYQAGLARALSKLGYCSRSQARELVLAGRVQINEQVQRNPDAAVKLSSDKIAVDGELVQGKQKVYLMLNKPRGLVTTASDEQGRQTVLDCLVGCDLPWVSPVGRLDKASEGLLLLSNDTAWAARLMEPSSHVEKTYHVQVDRPADSVPLEAIRTGLKVDGDWLAAKKATILRTGAVNSWIEVVLDEGKNRQIRRLLEALDVAVLRLVRVAIGPLQLGNLQKGQFRHLTPAEVASLGPGRPAYAIKSRTTLP